MTLDSDTLVCDANILIDYFDTNKRILRLASAHRYRVLVPLPVFDEVTQMTDSDAGSLGIELIEPSLEQLFEASNDQSALSDQDCLCLILARDNGWTCATNEKVLYNRCKGEGIAVIRGLRIMLELHLVGRLTVKEAMDTVNSIHSANPRLAQSVVNDFEKLLKEQDE